MKIKKGHLTGFFSTIIVFAIVFLYIYNGTMETTWIYNLENKTKSKIGKNIVTVKYSSKEDNISYTSYNGTLKLSKINDIKNPLITKKDINFSTFTNINNKEILIFINKSGEAYTYDFKNTNKINIDCFNDFVYVYNEKLYSISPRKVEIYNFKTNKTSSQKIQIDYDSQDNIYTNKSNLCIFSKNKLNILNLDNFSTKSINISDYFQKGIYEDDNIIYINSQGNIVINTNIIDDIKPYNYLYKNNKIFIATKDKIYCYNTNCEKLWSKDVLSNFIALNNKGDLLSSIYKGTCAFYNTENQEEQFTIDAKKVDFSASDENITVTEKSQF